MEICLPWRWTPPRQWKNWSLKSRAGAARVISVQAAEAEAAVTRTATAGPRRSGSAYCSEQYRYSLSSRRSRLSLSSVRARCFTGRPSKCRKRCGSARRSYWRRAAGSRWHGERSPCETWALTGGDCLRRRCSVWHSWFASARRCTSLPGRDYSRAPILTFPCFIALRAFMELTCSQG